MRSPRVTCTAVAGTYPGHSELPEAANNWTQSELGLRNNCPVQFDNRDTNFAYLISLVIPTQVSLFFVRKHQFGRSSCAQLFNRTFQCSNYTIRHQPRTDPANSNNDFRRRPLHPCHLSGLGLYGSHRCVSLFRSQCPRENSSDRKAGEVLSSPIRGSPFLLNKPTCSNHGNYYFFRNQNVSLPVLQQPRSGQLDDNDREIYI